MNGNHIPSYLSGIAAAWARPIKKEDEDSLSENEETESKKENGETKSKDENQDFRRGHLVWGKMKGSPPWPGFILDAADCNKRNNKTDQLWIFWFSDYRVSEIKKSDVSSFKEGFAENFHKCPRKHLKVAIDEAFYILAQINRMKYEKENFLEWAKSEFVSLGFKSKFRWIHKELPEMIEDAISRRYKTPVESNEEDGAKKLIEKVRNGEKMLQDICIACCNTNAIGDERHPLFIGRMCLSCIKDVNRANRLPVGRMQIYCVICGQGGKMVFCSMKTCKRGYCAECINYLDSKAAFNKIVTTECWECYYCHPVKTKKCLIKKRAIKRKVPDELSFVDEVPRLPNREKTDLLVRRVFDGTTALEAICIGCCEEELHLLGCHPLFIGGVCINCYEDIIKVCNLPYGTQQPFCIVCGQGGHLVYCDDAQCLRAYCRPCIEWLDHNRSFASIKRSKKFLCYLCLPSAPLNNCLIKRRFDPPSYSYSNDSLTENNADNKESSMPPTVGEPFSCNITDSSPPSPMSTSQHLEASTSYKLDSSPPSPMSTSQHLEASTSYKLDPSTPMSKSQRLEASTSYKLDTFASSSNSTSQHLEASTSYNLDTFASASNSTSQHLEASTSYNLDSSSSSSNSTSQHLEASTSYSSDSFASSSVSRLQHLGASTSYNFDSYFLSQLRRLGDIEASYNAMKEESSERSIFSKEVEEVANHVFKNQTSVTDLNEDSSEMIILSKEEEDAGPVFRNRTSLSEVEEDADDGFKSQTSMTEEDTGPVFRNRTSLSEEDTGPVFRNRTSLSDLNEEDSLDSIIFLEDVEGDTENVFKNQTLVTVCPGKTM